MNPNKNIGVWAVLGTVAIIGGFMVLIGQGGDAWWAGLGIFGGSTCVDRWIVSKKEAA
jgi:hypothetical protein